MTRFDVKGANNILRAVYDFSTISVQLIERILFIYFIDIA
jgi:hypothetical protein